MVKLCLQNDWTAGDLLLACKASYFLLLCQSPEFQTEHKHEIYRLKKAIADATNNSLEDIEAEFTLRALEYNSS